MIQNTLKIIICDDHEIFRQGLKLLMKNIRNVELVGEASDGNELIAITEKLQPHIIFTDIKMPNLDGISATQKIIHEFPNIKIIALSMFDDEKIIVDMLDAGAMGYMLKNADKWEFEQAIETVMKDETYYCKHTSTQLAKIIALHRKRKSDEKNPITLNPKELDIVQLICQEYTNKEIAEKLYMSSRTVEGYRLKILEKLKVKNVAGLVIEAIRLGIFDPEKPKHFD